MNDLPNELLAEILSYLRPCETLRLERVCLRWGQLIHDLYWTRTTLTERDLDEYAPPVVQMENLARLVPRLKRMSYVFVPGLFTLIRSVALQPRDSEFSLQVLRCLCRLESAVRRRLLQGCIAIQPTVQILLRRLQSMRARRPENRVLNPLPEEERPEQHDRWIMNRRIADRSPEPEDHAPASRAVTIPSWRVIERRISAFVFELGGQLTGFDEITFEHLESSRPRVDHVSNQVDPFLQYDSNFIAVQLLTPCSSQLRVRVLRVTLACSKLTFDFRLSRGVFSNEQTIEVLNALLPRRKEKEREGIVCWTEMVTEWQSVGRIEGVEVSFHAGYHAVDLLKEAFDPNRTHHPTSAVVPLLRAALRCDRRSIYFSCMCDPVVDMLQEFHQDGLLSTVSNFEVHAWSGKSPRGNSDKDVRKCSHENERPAPFPEVFWRTLTSGDALTNVRSLYVTLWLEKCDWTDFVPRLPPACSLPFLEKMTVKGILYLPYLLSILSASPRLRHLDFTHSTDFVPRSRAECQQWTDQLLTAIAQKRALISLSIEVCEHFTARDPAPPSHIDWVSTWLTVDEPLTAMITLRRQVLDVVMSLSQLEYLELRFDLKNSPYRYSCKPLADVRDHLLSTHPRLRYVHFEDVLIFGERDRHFKTMTSIIRIVNDTGYWTPSASSTDCTHSDEDGWMDG